MPSLAFLCGPYFAGSVRARLLRLAMLLLMPGLLISALMTWRVFVTERRGAETALRETARGLSQVVDREFVQAEVLLRTLAATDELRSGDMAKFDRLARATRVMGGTIVMVDRSGQEWVDTGLPPGAKLPRDQAPPGWDAEVPGRIAIAAVLQGQRKAPSIEVVLPVTAGGAGHDYDLKLVVTPDFLRSVLVHENLPAGWIAVVLDEHSIVVARTEGQDRYVGRTARAGLVQGLAAGARGIRDSISLEGTPVIVAFDRSLRTGWMVAVNAPRSLIAQAGRQSTWLLVWMGTTAILLGLLGALHVASGIAGRIEAMAKAARTLGRTERWRPIPPGLDEADAVAEAMQAAAEVLIERREALSELNATLAARVDARTAELAEANRALDEQRSLLGSILDHMPVGVVVHRQGQGVVFANIEARRLLCLPAIGEIASREWPPARRGAEILPTAEQPWVQAASGVVTERTLLNVERPGGGQLDLEVNAGPLQRDPAGRVVLSITSIQDVTARLEAEEARRRSQRLEAVGQLTGGVAHEFNNLLMAISGCLELLAPFVQTGRGPRLLANAARATERGGRLTRQLLAFSRRQHLQPQPVDLNLLVEGMTELLEGTLGRLVEVVPTFDPHAWPAMADASQLELVLLNLAINARDAMPGGGKLMITTANMRMGAPQRAEDPPAGDYAVLNVSDTGEGMQPQVLARAFEPFFTTKDIGLGSGLGLPQVLGVAQQLGGGVSISSAPGRGTTVRVYLPRADTAPGRDPAADPRAGTAETLAGVRLLIVDDDADVREIARDMLAELGAIVAEAESAASALLHLRTAEPVDIVLADLTMPHVTGIELAREIATFQPHLPIVLMTGYGATAMAEYPPNIRATLQKPFRADALAKMLARLLGRIPAQADL